MDLSKKAMLGQQVLLKYSLALLKSTPVLCMVTILVKNMVNASPYQKHAIKPYTCSFCIEQDFDYFTKISLPSFSKSTQREQHLFNFMFF